MQKEKEEAAFNFEEFKNQAIADMKAGKALVGKDGIFTPLMKEFLEAALEGEMNAHMACCLEEPENENRRNGRTSKTVRSPMGAFELETPRDREGNFDPQIVKKRQTVLNASLDNKILGLYGLGMSYQDIASHLKEMYAFDVSPGTISAVTDKLVPLIADWRARPLEFVYPILFMDGMYFKSRENGAFIVEIPELNHDINNRVQHPRGNVKGGGLTSAERADWNRIRMQFNKERAKEELLRRGKFEET